MLVKFLSQVLWQHLVYSDYKLRLGRVSYSYLEVYGQCAYQSYHFWAGRCQGFPQLCFQEKQRERKDITPR